MKKHFNRKWHGVLPAILASFMLFAFVPKAAGETGLSSTGKNMENTRLGIVGLSSPDTPANKDTPWSGSYVYFGSFGGSPIRFRVLARNSTAYTSGKALFLDSDVALFDDDFDHTQPYFNSWYGSSIRETLNGPFLEGFSAPEQAAIAVSTGDGKNVYRPGTFEKAACGAPVSIRDKVFLLDPAELRNILYGYYPADGRVENNGKFYSTTVYNHQKASLGRSRCWLTRSAVHEGSEVKGYHVLAVLWDGAFYTETASDAGAYAGSGVIGVAPAMNISHEAILFNTSVGTGVDEYKLTVLDSGLAITVPEGETVSAEGSEITVPYRIEGPDAAGTTRASVLVLDREYTLGNSYGAGILLYAALGDASGTAGSFVLPDGCSPEGWGTDYFVYILPENIHGPHETDDAGIPVPLNAPGSSPAAGVLRDTVPEMDAVQAVVLKDESNTCLGTAGIRNPVPGGAADAAWSGCYVYFGTWEGQPIRFRVLAKDATAYTSGKSLFLDSDEVLFVDSFDSNEPSSAAWENSSIREKLNGPFLEGFALAEQAAIAVSTGSGGRTFSENSPEEMAYGAPVPVNDRVFLPDVADITNAAYGYSPERGWNVAGAPRGTVPNRVKGGAFTFWWLRTASAGNPGCVGNVNCGGSLYNNVSADCYMGVAPAMNISQESILFATTVGDGKDEFKLTLIDPGLSITVPENEKAAADGTAVTLPYEISGADAGEKTRASVLILDKEYTPGNTNGAKILCYSALGSARASAGIFRIPAGFSLYGWGTDYHVYILAENINGTLETDSASVPVPVNAPED